MFLVFSPDEVVIQVIENEDEFNLVCAKHILKSFKEEVSNERDPMVSVPIILRNLLEKLPKYKLVCLE